MGPLFSQATKETLAKRSAYLCSNPDCRTLTAGPTESPTSAAMIGEAAHIFGAKLGSARYRPDMSDGARAEITNGIWLCRNCHKLIDADVHRYSVDTLFAWRSIHDKYVTERLGNKTDKINELKQLEKDRAFGGESLLCQRIIRERLPYWEYRLTAEALRDHLRGPLRDWKDLSGGLYVKMRQTLDTDQMFPWISAKMCEAVDVLDALSILCTQEIQRSWGEPGVEGDPQEILHVCRRIAGVVSIAVQWEEEVRFLKPPEEFENLITLFRGSLGRNVERIPEISRTVDEGVDWAEEHPGEKHVAHHDLLIDLPDDWASKTSAELAHVRSSLGLH